MPKVAPGTHIFAPSNGKQGREGVVIAKPAQAQVDEMPVDPALEVEQPGVDEHDNAEADADPLAVEDTGEFAGEQEEMQENVIGQVNETREKEVSLISESVHIYSLFSSYSLTSQAVMQMCQMTRSLSHRSPPHPHPLQRQRRLLPLLSERLPQRRQRPPALLQRNPAPLLAQLHSVPLGTAFRRLKELSGMYSRPKPRKPTRCEMLYAVRSSWRPGCPMKSWRSWCAYSKGTAALLLRTFYLSVKAFAWPGSETTLPCEHDDINAMASFLYSSKLTFTFL